MSQPFPNLALRVCLLLAGGMLLASAPTARAQAKPSITSQPQSQSVAVSSNAIFSVVASGQTPLSYQWSFNGTSLTNSPHIAGAISAMLIISNTAAGDAGIYRVVVSNSHGTATSSNATLTVLFGPTILSQPASQVVVMGKSVSFGVVASGSAPLSYQWFFGSLPLANGPHISGAQSSGLTVYSVVPTDVGNYQVIVSDVNGLTVSADASLSLNPVAGWGDNSSGQLDVPATLTNAVSVAAGFSHSLALQADRTVVAWGDNRYGQTNVPAGMSNIVAIAAGYDFNVALRSDGTVVAWGDNSVGQTNVPSGLSNVIAVAAQAYHSVGLRSDGTLVEWGYYNGVTGLPPQPANLNNFLETAPGGSITLALRSDGTTIAWGGSSYNPVPVFAGVSNAVGIAAGENHSAILRSDGSVVAISSNFFGETNVPPGATNIVALAAGANDLLALKADGTLIGWGRNDLGQATPPPGLTNVVAMAAGGIHSLALLANGPPHLANPAGLTLAVAEGETVYLHALATGQTPLRYQWQFQGAPLAGKTNRLLMLANLTTNDAGNYAVVVSNSFGAVTGTVATLSTPQCARPAAGLVSWWRGDTNTDDVTGVNPGTLRNATYVPGRIGQAFFFDGLGDGVEIGTAPSLQLQDFTIEAWIKRASASVLSFQGNGNGTLFALGTGGGGYGLWLQAGDGRLTLGKLQVGQVPSSAMVTDTNWHHIAVTKQGQSLMFYLDGVAFAAPPFGSDVFTFTAPGYIGCWQNPSLSLDNSFFGAIDELAVYNRALTPAELTEIFSAGSFGKCLDGIPPVIYQQPVGGSFSAGFDLALWTVAAGLPGPAFQWFFNGTPLAGGGDVVGAQSNALYLVNAQTNRTGNYFVVATNAFGSATSSVAALTITDAAPIIYPWLAPPASQTRPPGSNVLFSAFVAGSDPKTLQWFFNGVPLTNNARVTGADSATLVISELTTNDTGFYTLTATNAFGSATTSNAFLFVGVAPVIVQSPASRTNLVGANATFSVVTDGTTPLSYQWRGANLALLDGGTYQGVTTATLTISNLTQSLPTNYTVVVTNFAGAVTSAVATLTVVQAPKFTAQPVGRRVVPGLPTTFTAAVTGDAPISYQWQFNGADISDATNASYTIAGVTATNFGGFRLVASNAIAVTTSADALLAPGNIAAWGNNNLGQTVVPLSATNVVQLSGGLTSSSADHTLAVRADGSVVAWGNNANGQCNVPATLSNAVAAAAGGTHTLALRADGKVVAWGNNGNGQVNVPATLSNVIAIAAGGNHSLALRWDGKVFAWGNNSYGQSSVPTNLNGVVAIAAGLNQSLAIRADGTAVSWGNPDTPLFATPKPPPPSITDAAGIAAGQLHGVLLRRNGSVIGWGDNSFGQTNVPANLTNATAAGAGDNYSMALRANGRVAVWGRNEYGQTNIPAVVSNVIAVAAAGQHLLALIGDGSPLITRQPVGGASWLGRDFVFNATAAGNAPLSYQWLFNGTNLDGATNATLALANLALSHTGNYQLLVSNTLGFAASVPVPLTVLDQTNLTLLSQPPVAQTNLQGGRLWMSASVAGNGPLQFQWKLGGADISGATGADLIFDPVLLAHAGIYSVAVSNGLSGVASVNSTQRVLQVKAWGRLYTDYPPGAGPDAPASATNIIAVALDYVGQQSTWGAYLALRNDGKVIPWGVPQYGETNLPASVTNFNITAIAGGFGSFLALRSDGLPVAWGYPTYSITNVPATANNVVAIACGDYHDLALRSDGTVVAWGRNTEGQCNVPAAATNVVTIAGGGFHSLALRANGTVAAWGPTSGGATNVSTSATNVIAITAGNLYSAALRADGTVVQWGSGLANYPVPTGLSNVVALAGGYSHVTALREDCTMVTWGFYYTGSVTNITDVFSATQIVSRGDRDIGIFGTRAPAVTVQPWDRTLFRGSNTLLVAKCVSPQPMSYQWRFNGTNIAGATRDTLTLTNLQFANSGAYQLVASNGYGVASSRAAKLVVAISLPEALDTTNVNWISTNGLPWLGLPDVTHDGVDAARSGGISHGQESVLQTTVTGPGQLSFWWKVSSEPVFDVLEFKIDGVVQSVISGEQDWAQVSVTIPANAHTLQWRYAKDASNSGGADAGWVDQVVWTPLPPAILSAPISQTIGAGNNLVLSVNATSIGPLTFQWKLNGTNLPGATTSSLPLGAAFWTNAGVYSVTVGNTAGSTSTAPAIVNVAPVLFAAPSSNLFSLTWGGTFTLQSATNPGGPFGDLLGATSPFAVGTTGPLNFFRLKSEPFALSLSNQPGGAFKLSGAGISGYNFVIQSSTNLANWIPVATNPSPF
ncbi:MAG: hypothetical protein EXS35_08915 [Pedosphaera sp.]|nr:hypothetical protein [Pedosphaera sp.]